MPAESRQLPFNWVSEKLGVVPCVHGQGQIALEPMRSGELICAFGGRVMTLEACNQLPPEVQEMALQISEVPALVVGPMSTDEFSNGDYFNHSCSPNAGLRGDLRLVALRDIAVGEAITFDYATCMTEDDWTMECHCGTANCRQQVSGRDWMIQALQREYAGHWMSFIQERIDAQSESRSSS